MNLSVENLSYSYKTARVLNKINFDIKAGSITAILGPNGVGKTTLLKCLNRILTPDKGRIIMDGADLNRMSRPQIARQIGYVAQQNTGAGMTVFDAVLMGRLPHSGRRLQSSDLKKANAVLTQLNLSGMGLKPLDRLSGGERQMVAIARALVQETRVLLMDEPTASLDLKNQLKILDLIRHIVKGHNMAAVMTLHDLNTALRYADRYICLKDQALFDSGPIDKLTPDTIKSVYGVDVEIVRHNGHSVVIPGSCRTAA